MKPALCLASLLALAGLAQAAPPSGMPRGAERAQLVSSLSKLGAASPAFASYAKDGLRPKVKVKIAHNHYDNGTVAVVDIVAGHKGAWENGDRGGRKTVSQGQFALHQGADGKLTAIQIRPISATYAGFAMTQARAVRNAERAQK